VKAPILSCSWVAELKDAGCGIGFLIPIICWNKASCACGTISLMASDDEWTIELACRQHWVCFRQERVSESGSVRATDNVWLVEIGGMLVALSSTGLTAGSVVAVGITAGSVDVTVLQKGFMLKAAAEQAVDGT
jgi:hypothetical protein